MRKAKPLALVVACQFAGIIAAVEPVQVTVATKERIRSAVLRSLPLLEQGARGATEQRAECFTCHNQALPVIAFTTARNRGFAVDDEFVQSLADFTAGFLARNQENYRLGRGQGGQAFTAGYALWALDVARWKPDATTEAVAEFLLLADKDLGHWRAQTSRPPSEHSAFAASFVAVRGLNAFAVDAQKSRAIKRTQRARSWLKDTNAADTEDRVFRLLALRESGADVADIAAAKLELLRTQRHDGGWSQTTALDSDAYATGTSLVALHLAAGLPNNDPAYERGVSFLVNKQLPDGSWLVHSRSKPFQKYFESGFPHGEDQFISITASAWATTALALVFPPESAPRP